MQVNVYNLYKPSFRKRCINATTRAITNASNTLVANTFRNVVFLDSSISGITTISGRIIYCNQSKKKLQQLLINIFVLRQTILFWKIYSALWYIKGRFWGIKSSQSGKWRKFQLICYSSIQGNFFHWNWFVPGAIEENILTAGHRLHSY